MTNRSRPAIPWGGFFITTNLDVPLKTCLTGGVGNSAYANKELILTRRERILLRVCMYVQYVLAIAAALKGVFSQQGSTVLGIALMVLPLLAAIGMGAVLRLDKRQRKESE